MSDNTGNPLDGADDESSNSNRTPDSHNDADRESPSPEETPPTTYNNVNDVYGNVTQTGPVDNFNNVNHHYYSNPEPKWVSRSRPVVFDPWVDRVDFFASMNKHVDDSRSRVGPLVLIAHGENDSGRTSAASEWARRVEEEKFPAGTLYCDVKKCTVDGIVNCTQVLTSLLGQLEPTQKTHWPKDFADLQARWRTVTRKPLLVLLDNLEDRTILEKLLPSSPEPVIVVISRYNAKDFHAMGAKLVKLKQLEEKHCVQLLREFCADRVENDPIAAIELVRFADFRASKIKAAGAELAADPDLSIAEYLQQTQDASTGIVEHSLQYNLSSAHRKLLYQLAAHPGADFDAGLASWLATGNSQEALEALAKAQLITGAGEGRWQLTDAVRRFHFGEDIAAFEKIAEYYLRCSHLCDALVMGRNRLRAHPLWDTPSPYLVNPSTAAEAAGWVLSQRDNIGKVQQRSFDLGRYTMVWALEESAGWLVRQSFAPFDLGNDTIGLAITAAQREENPLAEARMRQLYANSLIWDGQFEAAEAEIEVALQLARVADGSRFVASVIERLEASVIEFKGVLFLHSNRFDEAIPHFDAALRINRELGLLRAEALQLRLRGECHLELDNLSDAQRDLEQALAIFEQGGESNHHTGQVLVARAKLHAKRGESADAYRTLVKAVNVLTDAGAPVYVAPACRDVGDILYKGDSTTTAEDCWREGLDYLTRHDNGASQLAKDLRQRLGDD